MQWQALSLTAIASCWCTSAKSARRRSRAATAKLPLRCLPPSAVSTPLHCLTHASLLLLLRLLHKLLYCYRDKVSFGADLRLPLVKTLALRQAPHN